MNCLNRVCQLYHEDRTEADKILIPQRWCNHQWRQLTSPLDRYHSPLLQIAERIIKIILLLIPTLLSYGAGLVGICLKAIEWKIFPPEPLPSIASILSDSTNAHPFFSFNAIIPQAPTNGRSVFTQVEIGLDAMEHIATFLTFRQRISLMTVSKEFQRVMKSPVLWSEYLSHPELRIWGGTLWSFKHVPGIGYQYRAEDGNFVNNPYDQLRAYQQLCRRGEAGPRNQFFDYIARLMPGGPLKFSELPRMSPARASSLKAEDMPGSIVCGADLLGNCFFAMLIVDRSKDNLKPVPLVFVRAASFEWKQVGNEIWPENSLNIANVTVLNYILAILSEEDISSRTDLDHPKAIKTIELIAPNEIPVPGAITYSLGRVTFSEEDFRNMQPYIPQGVQAGKFKDE